MAHLGAGGANSMESNGIGYIVGEPGLLVADTASPTIRSLLYQYQPQPSLANDPPVGFAQGNSVVDLRAALQACGAIIAPNQTTAQILAANNMAYYQGANAFKGPQGDPGPGATDAQVQAQVTTWASSASGTAVLTPLVQSDAQAWLTANQASLASTVAGPARSVQQEQQGPRESQELPEP